MAKVKVYKWTKYEPNTDKSITSHRMATRETVVRLGGAVVESSEVEIDASQLEQDGEGWTSEDFSL